MRNILILAVVVASQASFASQLIKVFETDGAKINHSGANQSQCERLSRVLEESKSHDEFKKAIQYSLGFFKKKNFDFHGRSYRLSPKTFKKLGFVLVSKTQQEKKFEFMNCSIVSGLEVYNPKIKLTHPQDYTQDLVGKPTSVNQMIVFGGIRWLKHNGLSAQSGRFDDLAILWELEQQYHDLQVLRNHLKLPKQIQLYAKDSLEKDCLVEEVNLKFGSDSFSIRQDFEDCQESGKAFLQTSMEEPMQIENYSIKNAQLQLDSCSFEEFDCASFAKLRRILSQAYANDHLEVAIKLRDEGSVIGRKLFYQIDTHSGLILDKNQETDNLVVLQEGEFFFLNSMAIKAHDQMDLAISAECEKMMQRTMSLLGFLGYPFSESEELISFIKSSDTKKLKIKEVVQLDYLYSEDIEKRTCLVPFSWELK